MHGKSLGIFLVRLLLGYPEYLFDIWRNSVDDLLNRRIDNKRNAKVFRRRKVIGIYPGPAALQDTG